MAALPTGTVTFLFTDIEASTRLLARDPEAYPDLVAAQRAIIAAEAQRGGGVVVGHEGDSCFLAFPDAAAAIAAVARAQCALQTHAWPGGRPVRVRCGLHTGTAGIAADDYYGLAVHTAARVADAAHGGQILLTGSTVSAGMPPGWSAHDLGPHRLRDIDDAVRLYELAGPGLASGFPPVRALPVAALHVPASSFVGREDDTDAILDLLDGHRLVTLVGPGGIGKTRLALHAGTRAAQLGRDGVWFADLTRTADPDTVADLVADAVGVSVTGGGDALAAVCESIAGKRGLLIVDNFEHVMRAVGVVAALVDQAPRLRVLATSRERLRLTGEQVYLVEPLDVGRDGAAVRLFRARANAVTAADTPSDEQDEAITAICARLDGLPLAIELAAAQCRLYEPAEIASHLAQRPLSLAGGPRDLHRRQQTMRNTIEWSHQLLAAGDRTLFAALAVFASPARVAAVEEVCGPVVGEDVADALARLVDKSLVQRVRGSDGRTRVRMLELVGEFAAETLATLPDAERVRRRHAMHYVDWVDEAGRAMVQARPDWWVQRIEAELADVSRAFAWCTDHDPAAAVRLYGALGFFFHRTGMGHLARRWMAQVDAVEVPPELDIPRAIANGFVHFNFHDLERARSEVQHALDVARATADTRWEAHAMIGVAHSCIGAPEHYDRALALVRGGTRSAREARCPVLVGLGYNVEGEVARVHGDDGTADAAYRAGIEVGRQVEDHQLDAVLHGNRVYIATRRGALDEAIELARYAVDLHQRYGHRNQLPWVAIALAGALVRQGRVEDAAVLVASAEASARRLQLEEIAGDVPENEVTRALIADRAGEHLERWSARGRATSLDETLRVVLDVPEPPGGSTPQAP